MIQARTIGWPARRESVDQSVDAGALGAMRPVAGLRAELIITPDQSHAWERFAAALMSNRERIEAVMTTADEPFGSVDERLAALAQMRRSAAMLLEVLDPGQRRIAMQMLPLCCLPAEMLAHQLQQVGSHCRTST